MHKWFSFSSYRFFIQEIAVTYNVRSLPTFLFLRGTKVVDRLMGANAEKLKSKVQKHCKLDLAEPGSQSSSESKKQVLKHHTFSFVISYCLPELGKKWPVLRIVTEIRLLSRTFRYKWSNCGRIFRKYFNKHDCSTGYRKSWTHEV